MRKIKKSSPDRDAVPDDCLRVRNFYELVVSRMTIPDQAFAERKYHNQNG